MVDRPDELLVTFWGSRGSVPTPGRSTEKYGGNTTCVEVQYNDTRVILDAGTGIRNLGLELAANNSEPLDLVLLISHTHWDHIQGLPFFTPAYMPSTKLKIWGNTNRDNKLSDILGGQMITEYFPVNMTMLGAQISFEELPEQGLDIGPMKISWQQQYYHPGGSLRFAIEVEGKKLVFSSDVELEGMFAPEQETDVTEQRKQEYLDFIRGADLLIGDGQYTQEEYETKVGWGHTAVPMLLNVAHSAEVQKVAVFHHEPLYSDRKIDELYVQYGTEYGSISPAMEVFWAREGVTLSV